MPCLLGSYFLSSILRGRVFSHVVPKLALSTFSRNSSDALVAARSSKRLLQNSNSRARMMTSKIGIVGGGISGLRCADVLLEEGFEVTILEARDRLGGRMHQETLPNGHVVDLGPNWIHGTDHNPIFDLAKTTDTATHSWEDLAGITYDENGKFISNVGDISKTFWGIIMEAFKYSEHHGASIDPSKSLWDFFVEKASLMTKDDQEKEKAKKLLQAAEIWGAFIGSPIAYQSLKFFWLEECIDGENLFCAGTYQKILAEISAPAKAKATIHLNTKVTKIDTNNAQPLIHTLNGQTFPFDEIVITTPLGYLQKNNQIFHPPLPPRLSQAISSIGYGNLEKVYITFPTSFWRQTSDPPTGNFQWLHPSYALPPALPTWVQDAVDLSTLPSTTSHPTLLFYIFGDQGSLIASKVLSLPDQESITKFLTSYFTPYISKLPHYSSSSPDCIPTHCVATSWTEDEFAGNGSYSNFPIGLKEGDKDIEVMREGVPDRGLWFAGEHTAPFVALGTVTGAYLSGGKVAGRIARKYGRGSEAKVGDGDFVKGAEGKDGKDVNVRGFGDEGLKMS